MKAYIALIFLVISDFAICQDNNASILGKWSFEYLQIENKPESKSREYLATDLYIRQDSSFSLGLSEAAESGVIKKISGLLRLRFNESPYGDPEWYSNWSVKCYTKNCLVFRIENTQLNWFNYKKSEIGTVLFYYSKEGVNPRNRVKKFERKCSC